MVVSAILGEGYNREFEQYLSSKLSEILGNLNDNFKRILSLNFQE
jgi:hypothetical protein